MKLKAVLFDLDNTLYDYMPCHIAGHQALWKALKQKKKISLSEFKKVYSHCVDQNESLLYGTAASHNRLLYAHRIIKYLHIPFDANFLLKLEAAYWKGFFTKLKLSPGVKETLLWCKQQKLKLAIVSDLTAQIQFQKLKKLKLEKTFDVVITSEHVGVEKPHSRGFHAALTELGIKPYETIMIGDNPKNDVFGASQIGIQTILLLRKDMSGMLGPKPTYTANSFSQILMLLRKLTEN